MYNNELKIDFLQDKFLLEYNSDKYLSYKSFRFPSGI